MTTSTLFLPKPSIRPTRDREPHELDLNEVQLGDVLLFSGVSIWSRLVSFVDGTPFDHVAIVAPANFEHPLYGRGAEDDRTAEPWIIDVSFDGGRWRPLSAYEDRVTGIEVRRHRHPQAPIAVANVITVADETESYAWDRLLYLTLIGASRWSQQVDNLGTIMGGAFMQGLFELLARMRIDMMEGPTCRRTCADLIFEGFDCYGDADERGVQPHFGLIVPHDDQRGLLWWAAGVEKLSDFFHSDPKMFRRPVLDTDMQADPGPAGIAAMLRELAIEGGVSFPGLPDVNEDRLRHLVVDGVDFTLRQLIDETNIGLMDSVSDHRRTAWWLFDRVLRDRYIVTPADVGRTPSLYIVGSVRKETMAFRRQKK
jgi:hypothetical protein